jgi:PKD repeat protein
MNRRIGLVIASAALLVASGPGCDEGNTLVAPTLSAECTATPAAGTAPLTVAFNLNVSGAQGAFAVSITYGDGASGTTPDQPHTYGSPGTYTAAFTVKTTLQSALCSTTVVANASPPPTPPPLTPPPVAVFKSTPDAVGGKISGTAPFTVRFNMCASTDSTGNRLWFRMDFTGDGNWDVNGTTGANCRHDYTYAAGTYTARNCVTDMDADGQFLHPFQCRTYTVVAAP